MSNIDKQALREAAEKATAGQWVVELGDEVYAVDGDDSEQIAMVFSDNGRSDAAFIAAASPTTMLALLDELEAKDSSISTQQHEIRTLLNALEQATEKRNSDIPGQKRLIGWRASDYTDETSDPELAKNWAAAIGVLPIFEGDVNTKLSAAGIKGE
ncbi:ead/Ea22-like family protein [Escherichia coli]|nr:ead/Ea22-like family protein [Escherichia coli]HBA9269787.1 ead/Ea22-like family protein [Escherichia coli]HBB0004790.1 ead/Ea22-like family protein [Escherichia coli]